MNCRFAAFDMRDARNARLAGEGLTLAIAGGIAIAQRGGMNVALRHGPGDEGD